MSESPDWRIQWLVAQAKDERLTDAEVRSIVANFPHDPGPAMTPDNLREAVARAIALSYGVDPDDDAPLSVMCTADNQPVAWWMVYEEQAAAVLALPALSVPEGWVAVPREPTEEVCDAYYDLFSVAPGTETWAMSGNPVASVVWKAMLSAIPSPGGSSRPWPIDGAGNLGSAVASGGAGDAATASDWRCRSCGAPFQSAGGKIVGGTCPNGRPTCPLEPCA